MSGFNRIKPIRVQFKTACELLDISRESLRHIVRTDASFPRPIKTGESKQSPVYFDYAELVEWHNSKKVDQNKEPSHG
ncbi:transcriptional regulator [Acinetobacter baumannii]|nr:transcriptional regulator [Acinetobacter baumannii]